MTSAEVSSTPACIELRARSLSQLRQGRVSLHVPIVCLPDSREGAIAVGLWDQSDDKPADGWDEITLYVAETALIVVRGDGHRRIQIMDLISPQPDTVLQEPVNGLLWERRGALWTTEERVKTPRRPAFLFFVAQIGSLAVAKQNRPAIQGHARKDAIIGKI